MNKEFKRLYFIDFVEHFQKVLMKRHLGFISAFEIRGDEPPGPDNISFICFRLLHIRIVLVQLFGQHFGLRQPGMKEHRTHVLEQ